MASASSNSSHATKGSRTPKIPAWQQVLEQGQDAFDAGNFTQAAKLFGSARALAHATAPEGVNEAKCLGWLGKAYKQMGNNSEAEISLKHSLKIRQAKLGEDSAETGQVLQNLSWLLFSSDKKDEAIAVCRRAIKNIRHNSGPRSATESEFLLQLAILLEDDDSRKQETDHLFHDALSIQEEKYGKNSNQLITGLNAYSSYLVSEKRFAEADALLQRALKISRQKGENSLEVADELIELAYCAQQQDDHTKAIKALEKALDIRALHKSNDTAEILEDLGKNYTDQDKNLEAEPFLRNALTHYRNQKGVSPRTLINAIEELALNLHELQKYSEAESLLRESLELTEKHYPPNHIEIGIALHNLSRCLRAEGKYAEAEELLNRSLAIKRAQTKLDETDYAASLRNMARLKALQNKFREAIPFYEQCIEIYSKTNEKYNVFLNKVTLANVYLALDEYRSAEKLLLSLAHEDLNTYSKTNPFMRLGEELVSQKDSSMTVMNNDFSKMFSEQQSQAEAMESAQTLVKFSMHFQSLGGDGSIVATKCFPLLVPYFEGKAGNHTVGKGIFNTPALAQSLIGLTCVLASHNRTDSATKALRWAGAVIKSLPVQKDRVKIRLQVAYCWQLFSDYAAAQRLIDEAMAECADDKSLQFDVLNSRAHLLFQLAEFTSAKTCSETALSVGQALFGEDSPRLSDCYQTLSECSLALGDPSQALEYATKAAQQSTQDSEKHAQGLLLVGESLLALNQVDKAADQFLDVIKIYREKLGNADLKPGAIASSCLGQCFLRSNLPDKYRQAQVRFASALRVEERDSSNTDVLSKARNLNGLALVSYMVSKESSKNTVTSFEQSFGESKLADRYALDAAACIDKYIYSAFPNLSFAQQCAFINNINKQESSLLTVCSNPTSIKEAYGYLMKWKGLLLESLRQRELITRSSNDNPHLKIVLSELYKARRRLEALSYNRNRNESDIPTEALLNEAATKKEKLERELLALTANAITDPMSNLTAAKFCDLLQPDEVFIDIVRFRPFGQNEDRYAAVVCQKSESGKVDYIDLGGAKQIAATIQEWRTATTNGAAAAAPSNKRDLKFDNDPTSSPVSRQNYSAQTEKLVSILAPIIEQIGKDSDKRKYWICPEGDFSRVPWNSLSLIGNFEKMPSQICEIDSARELVLLRQNKNTKFANLENDPANSTSNSKQTSLLLAGLSDFDKSDLPALPGALEEVQALQEIAQKYDMSVKACTQESATKEDVTNELVKATVAHIATHGFVRTESSKVTNSNENFVLADLTTRGGAPLTGVSRDPLLDCGIFLAYPHTKDADKADAVLTAEEIAALDLSKCQLVTLSACQTGLGRGLDGQGVIGLRSAIISAGARCMLMSLWSIDDESSRELMKKFYSHLWSNKSVSKTEALRMAQKEIQAIPEWSEPRYWAGWVLAGDGFN